MSMTHEISARRRSPHVPSPADGTTDRRLIDLRHGGASWDECARALLMSKSALELRARRLRDANAWLLANGKPASGAPQRGKRGRPRSAVPRVSISFRVAPDVADALRVVAKSADVLLGEVVTEALKRAADRAAGKRVSKTPLGLDPGESVALQDGIRTEKISVNVPQPVFASINGTPPMVIVREHVTRMLVDLNFRLVSTECMDHQAGIRRHSKA